MTAPRIWPAESTSKGMSSVSDNPKERRASIGGETEFHASKSGVLGISIAKEDFGSLREKRKEIWRLKVKSKIMKGKAGLYT